MTLTKHRTRGAAALTGALTIGGAAILAAPTAVLGAQGDNEVVISVIEAGMPAVVTIQAPPASFATVDESGLPEGLELPEGAELPEDLRDLLPEDMELPEGFELPRDLGDLRDLLPEGMELPEGSEFYREFGIPFGDPGDFQVPGGTGSGVIIDPSGLIITNGHVVGSAEEVTVILDDGTVLPGTVTGVDTLTDFAFVDVEGEDLPAVTLGDSSDLRVGQLAVSIGNPLGRFPSSAAAGIISGLDRSIDVFGFSPSGNRLNHLIQTDAAVNSGNSGGALFDGDSELIGITTAQAGLNDGIGFALPIDLAKPIIEQAMAGEEITRPYMGVVYREIDAQVATDESLPVEAGAWVRAGEGTDESPVVEDSPADEAGIEPGDIITAVDGLSVDADNPLDLQVLRFAPGEEVTITVLRDGETVELPTTLGTRPADLGR
jgi:S1-C subfamily serine protease